MTSRCGRSPPVSDRRTASCGGTSPPTVSRTGPGSAVGTGSAGGQCATVGQLARHRDALPRLARRQTGPLPQPGRRGRGTVGGRSAPAVERRPGGAGVPPPAGRTRARGRSAAPRRPRRAGPRRRPRRAPPPRRRVTPGGRAPSHLSRTCVREPGPRPPAGERESSGVPAPRGVSPARRRTCPGSGRCGPARRGPATTAPPSRRRPA